MDLAHDILDVPWTLDAHLAAVQVAAKMKHLHSCLAELQDALGRRRLQRQANRDDQPGI